MSVRITKDHSADVLKAISLMGKSRILIGIPESEDSRKDGAPIGNAAIAYINDNGSPKLNIPARPFLRPGVEDSLPRVLAALRVAAAKGFTDPSKIDEGMQRAGMIAADSVRKRIKSQIGFVPLSYYTLQARLKGGWFAGLGEGSSSGSFGGAKRKGGFSGTKALIVTGSMLNSITSVVEPKA